MHNNFGNISFLNNDYSFLLTICFMILYFTVPNILMLQLSIQHCNMFLENKKHIFFALKQKQKSCVKDRL